jgi:glucan biosynthesis protein C
MKIPSAVNNRYFDGVDFWRAWLVILGVAVHASLPFRDWTGIFAVISQKFRMEAFFTLAGFLGSLSQSRQLAPGWLKRRVTNLVIPLIFGIVVLNQLCAFLILLSPTSERHRVNILPLYHLWFLVVLIGCCAVASLKIRFSFNAYLECRGKNYLLISVLILALFVLMQLDPLFQLMSNWSGHNSRLIGRFISDFALTGARIPFYLIFYQLGAGFARGDRWVELCAGNRVLLWALVGAGTALTAVLCLRSGSLLNPYLATSYGLVTRLLDDLAKSMVALGVSLLILRSLAQPRMVGPLTKRLAEASYTIYLVHLLFLGVVGLVATRIGLDGPMGFLASFGGTLGLSYMTHIHVVKRTRWGALLFNGRVQLHEGKGASAPPLA